jgi:hypothetical protein
MAISNTTFLSIYEKPEIAVRKLCLDYFVILSDSEESLILFSPNRFFN